MNWKSTFFLGILSAALSSIACIIYNKIYSTAFYVDFSKILNTAGIISSCVIGCLLMAVGYFIAIKWKGSKLIAWMNIFYSVLSFASIVGVLSFSLPLDMESPEMFPGLAIPMHFFPVLSFLTVYPFFNQSIIK